MSGESKTLTIRLIGNAKGAVGAIGATEKASLTLGQKMDAVGKKFNSVGKSTMRWGTRLTALTGAAAYFVVKAGAPYVDSLNKIQALTDANNQTMKRTAGFLERNSGAYAKMGYTSGDAASGVVELVKAGQSLHNSLKAVNATMVLAKAGELDVADASELVSNTLNTFSLKASKAADIANQLANAANISSADVKDIAEAFKYVAPVAAASGIKMKTVNALLAELANKGIKATNAGTGLRKFFLSLQAPAGAGGKAIKGLGVEVFDAAGKMRPFKDILGDLSDALKKATDKQRNGALRDIFGLTGANSAQVLTDALSGGVKELNKYEKGVTKAGAAEKLAKSASKGLAGTWASLVAQVKSIAQSIYRQFSPALDDILKKVQPIIAGFSKLSPHTKKMIGIFALVAAAAGPVLMVLGGIAVTIGAIMSPVGLVVAAIAALAGVFAFAAIKSKGFRGFLASFGPVIGKVAGFIKGTVIPALKEFGQKLMSAIGPGLKQIGDLIRTELLPAFAKIWPILKPVLGFLLKMFGSALIGAIKGVIQVIKGVVQVVSGVISLVADLIHGDWHAVWHDLVNIVKGVLNILIGAFKVWWNGSVLAIFKHGILSILGSFKGGWKLLLKAGKGGIKLLENVLKGIVRILTWPMRTAFKTALAYAKTGWRYIRGNFSGGVGTIKAVLRRILEVVTYPFRVALSTARNLVSSGIRRVVTFFRNLPGQIRSALSRVRSAVTGIFRSAGSWLWNAGKNIIMGLLRGIGSMIGQVQDKLHKLTNLIPDWKGPADKDAKLLQPAGQLIMGGFMDGLASRFGAVRSMLGGFTSSLNPSVPALAGAGGPSGSVYRGGYLNRSAGAPAIVVQVTVEGNVIGEKDFAKRVTPTVRDELVKIGKRNGGKIFGG